MSLLLTKSRQAKFISKSRRDKKHNLISNTLRGHHAPLLLHRRANVLLVELLLIFKFDPTAPEIMADDGFANPTKQITESKVIPVLFDGTRAGWPAFRKYIFDFWPPSRSQALSTRSACCAPF